MRVYWGSKVTKKVESPVKCCLYGVILIYALYFISSYLYVVRIETYRNIDYREYSNKDKYLIDTPGCRIENTDAFNVEILELLYRVDPISCTDKPLLTYVSRNGSKIYLNVNKSVISEYTSFEVNCCYINVTRNPVGPHPDDNLSFSECAYFEDSVQVESEVIKVKCSNIIHVVYENTHAILRQPLEKVSNAGDPNVILLGIDGVSTSNFMRTMPKTRQILEDDPGWVNLKGYNKVEDNTFPNIIAVLAGVPFSYQENNVPSICNPYDSEQLRKCNFLWNTFKKNNYSTAYAEDTPTIGTFNINKAGFVAAPTDYYFRPYFLATDQLTPTYLCLRSHCTGPEKTGIRMQNLVTDFLDTIKGRTPGFGLFWMNSFSHEDVNCPSSMDDEFEIYFKKLAAQGYLDNTIMVFFSDHGFRFGKMRLTPTGWLEERMPFIYIWIPKRFRKRHSKEFKNLQENFNKLTSPFDLHMTLQDVLSLSDPNFTPTPAPGCPKCHSLLKPVTRTRTCSDAGIPNHYCTCSNYELFDKTLPLAKKVGQFFIDELNRIIRSYGSVSKGCASFSLEKIVRVKYLVLKPGLEENYLVSVTTNPDANFEATIKVSFQNEKMNMSLKEINRLDRYAPTSYCVKNSPVQMYCYCKTTLKRLTYIFCNNKYCFL